jgi:hypothetical protein
LKKDALVSGYASIREGNLFARLKTLRRKANRSFNPSNFHASFFLPDDR